MGNIQFAEWPQIGRYLRDQPTVTKLWEAAERFSDKKPIHWKQQKLFYVRAFSHFSSGDFEADPPDIDGNGALAQVHPAQEPQENAARHRRSTHYVCK